MRIVRAATDLVALIAEHVPLRPRGREHIGLCPFHDDSAPSLTVVTHKGNAFYKCHACGAAGDVFNFVQEYHKMSFGEALAYLAERAGVTLTPRRGGGNDPAAADRQALGSANVMAQTFYRATLKRSEGAAALGLLQRRGFTAETIEAWAIGAAPDSWDALLQHARRKGHAPETLASAGLVKRRDNGSGHYDTFRNRLIFPIADELGRPIAFGGRQLGDDDGPKYLNSPESAVFKKGRTLYGLHMARPTIIQSGQVVLTEGYTDVVACHQAGFTNAVATLGTALTREHIGVLKRVCKEIVLVFDGDAAGQRAADRALEIVFAEPVDVRICVLPEGLDPADLLAAEDGSQRLREALDGSSDILQYKIDRYRGELRQADGLAERRRVLDRLVEDMARLGFDRMSGVHRGQVEGQMEQHLGIRAGDLEEALRRIRRPVGRDPVPAQPAPVGDREPSRSARCRAERDLLAVFIHQPSLRSQPVPDHDGSAVPAGQRYRAEQLRDPEIRAVGEVVLAWLVEGRDFSVQELMSALDEPAARRLAADLYLEGERRLGDTEVSPADHVREVCNALAALEGRERYREKVDAYRQGGPESPQDVEALREIIEQRRRTGYIPEAMPTGVRRGS